MTIPFSVEGTAKDCLIQLRDLADRVVIAEIFNGHCDPGVHTIEFDPGAVDLEAGIYILHVVIGGEISTYPMQYMP